MQSFFKFPSQEAHVQVDADFCFLSQALIYTARLRIRNYCIALCPISLRPSFRKYSLRLPMEGWPG